METFNRLQEPENDESFRRHMAAPTAAVQKLPPAKMPTKNGQIPVGGQKTKVRTRVQLCGPERNEGVCLSSALC